MKTRVRWFGKVRVCERKMWRGWKEVFRDDFSDKPAGFPVPPPFRAVVDTLFGRVGIDFPWTPGETVPSGHFPPIPGRSVPLPPQCRETRADE